MTLNRKLEVFENKINCDLCHTPTRIVDSLANIIQRNGRYFVSSVAIRVGLLDETAHMDELCATQARLSPDGEKATS